MMYQPSAPRSDYAKPELRALLDRGIEPLKAWIRTLSDAPSALGFHTTSEWDNHVLACYLAHFLPRLPPTGYWMQDIIIVYFPENWENEAYNRIFTQYSGNCLIPDAFHELLLALTRTFGKRFIHAWELIFWLEHGKAPDQAAQEQDLTHHQRLLDAIAFVEAQEGGVIDRSTMCILNPLSPLEWLGMLTVTLYGHQHAHALHVIGEKVSLFGSGSQESEVGRWFDEMRDRAYIPRYSPHGHYQRKEDPPSLSVVTAEGRSIVLVGPISDLRLEQIEAEMAEVQANRAIRTFLTEVWGPPQEDEWVQLFLSFGEEEEQEINACQVFDAQAVLLLPDLDLPFWQAHLRISPALQTDLDACASDEERMAVLNEFLFRGSRFKDDSLPDPKSEHPAFQRKVRLQSLLMTYPCLYEAQ